MVLFKQSNIVDRDTKHIGVTRTTPTWSTLRRSLTFTSMPRPCVFKEPHPHPHHPKKEKKKLGPLIPASAEINSCCITETQNVQMFGSRIPSAPGSAFAGHPRVNLRAAIRTAERHFLWQDLIELPFGETAPCLGTSAWQCLLSGGNCYSGLPYTVYTPRSILRHARPPLALLAYTQDFMMFTLYIQESA